MQREPRIGRSTHRLCHRAEFGMPLTCRRFSGHAGQRLYDRPPSATVRCKWTQKACLAPPTGGGTQVPEKGRGGERSWQRESAADRRCGLRPRRTGCDARSRIGRVHSRSSIVARSLSRPCNRVLGIRQRPGRQAQRLCGAGSRHQQLPPAGGAAVAARLQGDRRLLAHHPPGRGRCGQPAACRGRRSSAPSMPSRSARPRCGSIDVARAGLIATEACRLADNAPQFLSRVREETGPRHQGGQPRGRGAGWPSRAAPR